MALDTNIPLMGKPIDSANPLQQLSQTMRQNTMDKAALAGNQLDLQSKQNIFGTQVLAAAAGTGDQNTWTAAKQQLQQKGIDVSGIPDDIASGQKYTEAARLAQSPYGSLINAAGKMDANAAAAAGVNGTMVQPNLFMNSIAHLGGSPAAAQGSAPSAQPMPTQQAPEAPQGEANPNGPGMSLPGANQMQQLDPKEQQGVQLLKYHYDNASPEDQKQVQEVSANAIRLAQLQNDPKSVQEFLNDPKNIKTQANLELRDLWNSDQTPNKSEFWAENQSHINVGVLTGAINLPQGGNALPPAGNTADRTALNSGNIQQRFTPSQGPADESPKAKNDRIANELAIYKANLEADPNHAAAMKSAEAGATKNAQNEADKKAVYPKATAALNDYKASVQETTRNIDEAIALVNGYSTAGWGAALKSLPATDAHTLDQKLQTIKTNIGFDKLQDMRTNSPTGGALGGVSDFENRNLQAVKGSLDQYQKAEVLIDNLNQLKRQVNDGVQRLDTAYQQDFAPFLGQNNAPQQQSDPGGFQQTPSGVKYRVIQ